MFPCVEMSVLSFPCFHSFVAAFCNDNDHLGTRRKKRSGSLFRSGSRTRFVLTVLKAGEEPAFTLEPIAQGTAKGVRLMGNDEQTIVLFNPNREAVDLGDLQTDAEKVVRRLVRHGHVSFRIPLASSNLSRSRRARTPRRRARSRVRAAQPCLPAALSLERRRLGDYIWWPVEALCVAAVACRPSTSGVDSNIR